MNSKFIKYWLKRSLYYPAITLCAGIFLKIYFTVLGTSESDISSGSSLTDLAGIMLFLGAVYISFLSRANFGTKFNSGISYGATRRQSVSVLFSSTLAGVAILFLIFIVLCLLGSPDNATVRLMVMGLNLYLLSMIIAFTGGYLVMRYGKAAYYVATFGVMFVYLGGFLTLGVHYKDIPGSNWISISETFFGSPLISLGLAGLLVITLVLIRRGTEKAEVRL